MSNKELGPWKILVFGAGGLLTFLGGWELLVRMGVIDPFFLPAPSAVVERMTQLASGPEAVLWHDIKMSATRVLAGFTLSALIGVPFGLVMGMSPGVRATLNPIVSIIRPLPALSWIPLSMLWLGIDVQITDRFIELKREVWDLVQEEVMGSMTALQPR